MTCKEAIDRLCDYLDAELRPGDIAEFEAHLARCTACRRYFATYEKAKDLAAKVNRVAMPESLRTRLRLLLVADDRPS